MRVLLTIFGVIYLFLFFFSKVTVNGSKNPTILERAYVCLIGALLITILAGLPLLGVMYLLGELL